MMYKYKKFEKTWLYTQPKKRNGKFARVFNDLKEVLLGLFSDSIITEG